MKKAVYFIIISLLLFASCKKDAGNPVNTDTVPSPPTLATPKDTSTNVSVPSVLIWNESAGANSYTLQVSSSSSFSSFVINKNDITTIYQQISDLNYLSIYYWRVSASNSVGTSDWSKVWSFTTTGEEPAFVPQLSLPANGATDQKFPPMLEWNKVSNANNYTLQVSTNSSFTNFVFDADSLTATSIQLTNLSGLTKYYWRVNATNNFGTKGWSETWSFTTGVAPTPPVLLSPIDGATNQSLSPTLTWNASNGSTSYTLQVSTDSSFSSFIFNQSSSTTNKQLTGLTNTIKYYWRVSTKNNYGTSNFSDVWSFTTSAPPTPPMLLTPIDGTTDIALYPTLTWNASNGATSYTLQIASDNSFASMIYNNNIGNVTSKQINGLNSATKYYWRVRVTSNFGTSNPSEIWSFNTGVPQPAPSLLTPTNGATDISLSPTLTWDASVGATSYALQVSTNNSFSSFIFNQSSSTTNRQLTGLTNTTKYYWRVSTTNNYGTSNFSDVWSFTTGVPPAPPTLSTPLDGSMDVVLPLTLAWTANSSATSYTLQVSPNSSFSSFVFNQSSSTTNKQISGLTHSTKYYWRVSTTNNYGTSLFTPSWSFTTIGACVGTHTVTYSGKTYNTIQVGTQCWLKENLDIGTMIQGVDNASNNGTIEKYCYDNNPANCNTYGGLYQWKEAMAYSTTPGTKGICPTTWHIPTKADFDALMAAVSNDGNALKAVGQGTGTNSSGFSALFAGYRYWSGDFTKLGNDAGFWSSTENNTSSAYYLGLDYNASNVYFGNSGKEDGFSIRCVKD